MTDDRTSFTKIITMIITNKITGRDITTEYMGLMMGLITKDEFEVITLLTSRLTPWYESWVSKKEWTEDIIVYVD